MITSTSNDKVRLVRQLLERSKVRRKEGLFVAEGLRMVCETPADLLERVYVSEHFLAEYAHDAAWETFYTDIQAKQGIACEEVSDAVMRAMSDTVTPQGILAVIRQPEYSLAGILANNAATSVPSASDAPDSARQPAMFSAGSLHPPLLLILENIQDPGNLGTMFRTAEAAGAGGIIMSRDTVDVFSPKVIRSTMGSIYRVPWIVTENLGETIRQVKRVGRDGQDGRLEFGNPLQEAGQQEQGMTARAGQGGITVYAAYLGAEEDYDTCDYTDGTAFLIGNEGGGLRPETAALADMRISIPMAGQVESLNAAMSAGILMYEAARQRRHADT